MSDASNRVLQEAIKTVFPLSKLPYETTEQQEAGGGTRTMRSLVFWRTVAHLVVTDRPLLRLRDIREFEDTITAMALKVSEFYVFEQNNFDVLLTL